MITITVPATTANLGPGFDCLGMALGLYNTLIFQEVPEGLFIEVEGERAEELSRDRSNLVFRAAERVFQQVGRRPPGLRIRLINRIPIGYGLGSSAAAVVGGLLGANALLGNPLSRESLLNLAVAMEGHPDNVAPALLGGLIVASGEGESLVYTRVTLPPLRVVVAVPDVVVPTKEARRLLPRQVSLDDAVFNIGRTALVVLALERGDYDLLERAMEDRLHQPYRRRLIPAYGEVVQAAREAGAAAVAISGAGSGLVALAPRNHEEIAQAMRHAFVRAGIPARAWVLPVVEEGATVKVSGRR